MAYLTTFYLLIGKLPFSAADPYGVDLLGLMIGARSGTALAGLFIILAAVSEGLARLGRRRHGVIYLGGCGVVAVAGLLLVTYHGFLEVDRADALRAAILYAVYGAGSLALTARWRRLGLSYLGLALVTSAALWALWWQRPHHVGPIWGAVLAIEAFVMAAAAAVLQRCAAGAWYDPWKMVDEDRRENSVPRSEGLSLVDMYRIPLIHASEVAAMLAAALAVWTAWHDGKSILDFPTPAPIVASAAIAAVYFLLAWLYRSPARTWIASLIALAGTMHTLNFNYFQSVTTLGPNCTIGLLGHATLAVLAVLCLDRLRGAGEFVRRAIGDPLANSALLSSILAVPALIFGRSAGSLWLACCFPWLSAVWLMLARRKRSVELFAAHQAALAFAVLAAATVWMKQARWITPAKLATDSPNLLERIASYSHVFLEPRNLQVYGISLGLLSLVWVVVRIIDLRRGIDEKRLLQWFPSVDWCIRHGVVVMQWLVVVFWTLAEVPRELVRSAAPPSVTAGAWNAFGPTAWVLLGVMAVMLVATLWERWRTAELAAVLLAAATLPCLIAGRFAPDLAVASALRWGLAISFALCSVAVWRRAHLAEVCRRIGACSPGFSRNPGEAPSEGGTTSPEIPPKGETTNGAAPRVARGVLLATMVLPVLAITVVAAMLNIDGTPTGGGPLAKTFFAAIGPTCSYLVPLALVIAALVGYALRERSSGYAFSAGLVLEMAVMLGYALHSLARQPFDAAFFATLIQLFAFTAAAWSIVWLIARKRLDVWREAPATGISSGAWSRGLMGIQIGMAIIANAVVLGIALFVLFLVPLLRQPWSVTAGGPLGWIALVLTLAALQLRGRLRPHAVGLSGMAVLGLLACTIRGLQPSWQAER